MFTIEQIRHAHHKVKSGADFPAYIIELQSLGVISYETHVNDGHSDYFGSDSYKATSDAVYALLSVAENADEVRFRADLKAHQQGETDYPTFCNDCACSGIGKWVVDVNKMTCTYYDRNGNQILLEMIPQ